MAQFPFVGFCAELFVAHGDLRVAFPEFFDDGKELFRGWLDVYKRQAQTLIQEGKATISTAICTRDDIMTYLIGMGPVSYTHLDVYKRQLNGKTEALHIQSNDSE